MSRAKKRIYVTALAIAGLIAAIDFMAGEPSATEAAVPVDASDLLIPPDERAAAAAEVQEGPVFPFEPRAALPVDLRNPFEPPATVRLAGRQPAEPDGPRHDPDGPPTVAAFIEAHTLVGVMMSLDGAVAIVDDIAVDVGQTLGRATLLRVGSNSAYFQCADGVATLYVIED